METVSGKVIINLGATKKFEHKGIKLELMGIIMGTKDTKDVLKFISFTSDLETPGVLTTEVNSYPFKFQNVQKQYESYRGTNKHVKYLLRLVIDTRFRNLTYDQEFAVVNPEPESVLKKANEPIRLEVGIEDWLHLVFEVEQRNFGLKGIAKGKVTFKKVSIRMKSMEVQIIKKEIVNVQGVAPETTVITRFEIMDGGPVRNETIPIRFFLKPYDLTPTMTNINNRFSVQYFINLVLSDVEERKYFKQHEIVLHRIEKTKTQKNTESNEIKSLSSEEKLD